MATLPEPKIPTNVTRPLTEKEREDYEKSVDLWNKVRRCERTVPTFIPPPYSEVEKIPELCLGCETGTDNNDSHCIIDPVTGDTVYHPECYCMNKHTHTK